MSIDRGWPIPPAAPRTATLNCSHHHPGQSAHTVKGALYVLGQTPRHDEKEQGKAVVYLLLLCGRNVPSQLGQAALGND